MNETISIIIPTFNRSNVLGETLESVHNQTYQDWECIVVDDGSTDDTDKIALHYTSADERFQFIRRNREPKGASTCRNIGLKRTRGEYIIFLDSGDLLSSDCLAGRLQAIKQNQDCDFWVFCTAEFQHQPGDRNVLINVPTREDPILRFLRMDVMWLASGPLWKRTTVESLNGWDERLLSWQDWDLSVRALIQGKSFQYFSVTDNYWRNMEGESISSTSQAPEHLESHVFSLNKTRDLLKKENKLIAFEHYMRVLYFWKATEWARKREFRKSIDTWRQTSTMSNRRSFYFKLSVLVLLNIPSLYSIVYRMFIRFNHSYGDLFGGTYRKVLDLLPENKT